MNDSPIVFDKTAADLSAMAAAARAVDASDVPAVRRTRLDLRAARVQIEKYGKDMRDDANRFAKAVIAKERELIGIIEPEEERLAAIEEAARKAEERAAALAALPGRMARLAETPGPDVPESEVLGLTDNSFELLLIGRREAATRAEAAALAAREAAVAAREAAQKAEADRIAAREEKAAQEAFQAAEAARHAAREAENRASLDAHNAKNEAAFREFAASHGWTEETKGDFVCDRRADGTHLFRRVGVFVPPSYAFAIED